MRYHVYKSNDDNYWSNPFLVEGDIAFGDATLNLENFLNEMDDHGYKLVSLTNVLSHDTDAYTAVFTRGESYESS